MFAPRLVNETPREFANKGYKFYKVFIRPLKQSKFGACFREGESLSLPEGSQTKGQEQEKDKSTEM